MKDLLEQKIKLEARRLLTMLDRNPFGRTAGLFDRCFWHFKTTDFPSAILQMGMAILAKLYIFDEGFRNPTTLNWIQKSISATAKLQHSDGTFDEWYPNERGWAGPTGYLLNAFCDTYLAVGVQLDEQSQKALLDLISKSALALTQGWEGHVLTNHLAIVWLALVQAKSILKSSDFDLAIQSVKQQILANFNEDEGWSLEYDGADPGYQTGTLSFLSKGFVFDRDPDLMRCAEKSLHFISYFAYPDGSFGGAVGSRHTVNTFLAGLTAWRSHPIGRALCDHLESALKSNRVTMPSDLDDHYYVYRLYELLDAYGFILKIEPHQQSAQLPCEVSHKKTFFKAGLHTRREGDIYTVVSVARGGVVMAWNCRLHQKIIQDNGFVVSVGRRDFSSLWQGDYQSKIEDAFIEISGPLYPVTPKQFTPLRQVLFRFVVLIFANNVRMANWLKDRIRAFLIMNRPSRDKSFSRVIEFSPSGITVKTQVSIDKKPCRVVIGGEFWTRYVPQSRNYITLDSWKGCESKAFITYDRQFSHIEHYGAN